MAIKYQGPRNDTSAVGAYPRRMKKYPRNQQTRDAMFAREARYAALDD